MSVGNVPGLDNIGQVNFSGASVMPKYIFLRRGIDAPIGFAISLEPEWERIDNITGAHAKNYSMETRVYLDTELIEKKLLAATNIIYLPEAQNDPDGANEPLRLVRRDRRAVLSHHARNLRRRRGRILPDLAVARIQQCERLGPLPRPDRASPDGSEGLRLAGLVRGSVRLAAHTPRAPATVEAWNQTDLSRQHARMVFGVEF